MKSFKDLRENSFYTTQAEKSAFTSNDKLVINAFMFSFVGMVGLLDGAKDNTRVKAYFRSDQKLRPTEIGDDNQDSSLIIKIMIDQGFFKKSTIANEITRFLVKAKAGQIDSVDPEIIRGWIRDIKDDKMKGLSAVVRREVKEFLDGGSLATLADQLKANAKVTRWKESEFGATSKAIRIDPAKKKAAPAVTKPTTSSDDLDLDAPAAAVALSKTKASVPPSKPAAATVASTKKVKATKEQLFIAAKSGTDPNTLYLKPTSQDNTEMAMHFYDNILSLTDEEVQKIIQYLKDNPFKVNSLKDYMFPKSYYGFRTNDAKVLKALKNGIDSILGKTSKQLDRKLERIATDHFGDWIVGRPADWEKEANDPYIVNLAKMAKRSGWARSWLGGYLDYIISGKEQALNTLSRAYPNQIKKIGDNYTYSKDPTSGSWQDASLTSGHVSFLEFLGARKQSDAERQFKRYIQDGVFNAVINSFNEEEQKTFFDAVISHIRNRGTGTSYLKTLFSNSKTAKMPWQVGLLVKIADERITDEEIEQVFNPRSYGFDAFDPFELDGYPKPLAKKFLDAIEKFASSGLASDVTYKKLFDFAEKNNHKRILDSISKKYHADVIGVINKYTNKPYYGGYGLPTQTSPSSPQNEIRDIMNQKYRNLQDDIDSKYIEKVINLGKAISVPANKFADMSDANKRKVMAYSTVKDDLDRNSAYTAFSYIADDEYARKIGINDWVASGRKLQSFIELSSSPEFKKETVNKIVKDNNLKEKLKNEALGSHSFTKVSTIALIAESDLPESEFTDLVNQSLNTQSKYENESTVSNYAEAVNGKDDINKKDAIMLEKSLLWADQNMKKLTKEYRNLMTSAQPSFVSYSQSDRKGAAALYESMSKSMKKRMAAAYISNGEFALTAGGELTSDSNPIKPFEKLNDKRIRDILKYNNVVSEETKISDKHIKTLDTLDNYIKNENPDKLKKLEDLKVEVVEKTPKELTQMSVDLHRNKRNNRHGDVSMVIKKEFNVAIPLQVRSQEEWIEKDPNQEIINPMYHGTGSIAASMILRYGFRVIKAGDSSVVGRMLGDGVYGAIHIDKSQQYVGDAGYARTPGLRGYIFEMNAALGEPNKDYKAAGLGNRDGIRSPEWCVFTPNSQFKIFKAYEVELVRGSTMARILNENPPMKNESKEMSFKNYIKENTVVEEYPNYTTYTFVNGLIPTGEGEYVDFEEFKSGNKNVTLEPSSYGPSIVVKGTEESNDYIFTGPTDFAYNHPELFQDYLAQISE